MSFAVSLPHHLTVWALVAASNQIRLYECDKIRKLVPRHDSLHSSMIERSDWDLTPLPYIFQTKESGKSEAMSDATRDKMIASVSEALKRLYVRKFFDRLIVVAPAELMLALNKMLSKDVRKLIVAKSLVAAAPIRRHELLAYILPYLPPSTDEEEMLSLH